MKLRTLLLAGATMGLAAALALPASAQDQDSRGWQQDHSRWGWAQDRDDHDRGRSDNRGYANSDAYRKGYQDAENDRDHHHQYHPRGERWKGNDRQAYEAGYRAGYNGQYGGGGWNQDRDRDRDRDNRGYGGYPQGGYGRGGYGNGMAARMGYQDGLMYGRNDASRGKGYNATGSGYYEHADHGYNSSFGDKNQYRQEYRQAYQQGYQQGYQGGRYPGRR